MHIVALITGILSLVSLPCLAVVHSPAPLFLAIAFGIVAIVTGVLSRAQRAGKAGMVLGIIAVVGTLTVFLMFMSRSAPEHSTPVMVPSSTSER